MHFNFAFRIAARVVFCCDFAALAGKENLLLWRQKAPQKVFESQRVVNDRAHVKLSGFEISQTLNVAKAFLAANEPAEKVLQNLDCVNSYALEPNH